jgi:hypothetical protein
MSSDHRLIWVDIDSSQLLGNNAPKLWKPQTRRLKCNDPTIVQTFSKLRKQKLMNNGGLALLQDICSNELFFTQLGWQDTIERLDKLRIESMRFADRKCRRIKMGTVPWSPEIQVVMNRISYLQRCRLKYING